MARKPWRKKRAGLGWSSYAKAAGIIFVLGAVAMLLKPSIEYELYVDKETFCDQRGLTGVTVILIDASDPLDGIQTEKITAAISEELGAATKRSRVDVYLGNASGIEIIEPLISICNPGDVTFLDSMISDAKERKRQFEEDYIDTVEKIASTSLRLQPTDESPILESIRAASTSSFERLPSNLPKKFFIISDMLQNSNVESHYRKDISIERFLQSSSRQAVSTDLHGAAVTIFYVTRPSNRNFQNNGHLNWWAQYLRASGAKSIEVETL